MCVVENEKNKHSGYFSKKLRAGKRRTYFFDVKATKGNDFYLTITESKKRFNQSGYDSHKVFLYKEDFRKFIEGLQETIDHIKHELMPEFDYDNYSREQYQAEEEASRHSTPAPAAVPSPPPAAAAEQESGSETVPSDSYEEPAVTEKDSTAEDAMEWS